MKSRARAQARARVKESAKSVASKKSSNPFSVPINHSWEQISQILRVKSQMLVLFDFLCYFVGFVVSCCALDASKTQTVLVSAILDLFFEASWEQVSPKSPPEIAYPSAV